MITGIAWKNVWRNRSRSLIVIAAITVGVFAGVFTIAIMNSAVVQRIDAAVNEELSHIQINNRDFRSNGQADNVIPDYDSVLSVVSSTPGVKEATGRIIIKGMASTAAKSSGVEITGIDVEKEKQIMTLHSKLIEGTGSYFGSETRYNSAFIGEKLAKELNIIRFILTEEDFNDLASAGVPEELLNHLEPIRNQRFTSEKKFSSELKQLLTPAEQRKYMLQVKESAWSYREGSRIILTFLDINNVQTGAVFRVSGIFRTNNNMFEATSVFVPAEELRPLTGIPEGEFHRMIVRLDSDDLTDGVLKQLRSTLPGLEVLSWKDIQPDLAMMAGMMHLVYGIFMIIILAALAFGIVNTMLMAVLERTRELGMLAAIGMNKGRIFVMIMLESIFLSIVGGITGMIVGGTVIAATAEKGINLVKYADGFEAMGYSAHLYPSIDTGFFVMTAVMIVITGILSAVYPARKALKLNPVEAIRGEK